MSRGDAIWWLLMLAVRNPLFLPVLAVLTVLDWTGDWDPNHLWWNLGASALAIVVEAVVGRAMYAQTKRDALILREIKKLVERAEHEIEDLEDHFGK